MPTVPDSLGVPAEVPRSSILNDPRRDPPPPPGLRAQLGATRDAAKSLLMAHVDLARAEASAIGGKVARTAGLIGCAVAVVVLALLLVFIGMALFLAEWLLGSMGWGVLHGLLFAIAAAVTMVLAAVGVSAARIGRAFIGAVVIGVVVAVVLGLDAPNRLYAAIGSEVLPGVESGVRPLVVGTFAGALTGLVIGALLALRLTSGSARFAGLIGLAILGAAVGAFTAITFGPQVGIGIGIAVGYVAWAALLAADVARSGVDLEALKARFMPTQTIDTSKETLEWLRQRMPPGIGS
ncbi:MAG: hypothetical protein WEC14_05975 [Chloroflexota bacterium]